MRFLVDKSAWARANTPSVGRLLEALAEADGLATCAITNLEVLYSASSLDDYEKLRDELAGLEDLPVGSPHLERALEVQRTLAMTGHHRIPLPDLIISAVAESASATVLHYDADYERISEVTGQSHRWVVPGDR